MITTPRITHALSRWISVLALVMLSGSCLIQSARAETGIDQSLAVLMSPRPLAVQLSSDASRLAIIMRGDSLLRLRSLEDDRVQTALLPSTGRLHSLRWVSEDRLLLLWQTEDHVVVYQVVPSAARQAIVELARVARLDADSPGQVKVISSRSDRLWLSHDVRRNGLPDLFRLNLDTGRLSFERANPGRLFQWFHHPAGKMLLGWFWQRGSNGPRYQLRYLASGQSQWSDLVSHELLEPEITVLGFNDGGRSVDLSSMPAEDRSDAKPYRVIRRSLDGMNAEQELIRMVAAPRQLIWGEGHQAVQYQETESQPLQARSISPTWQARLARLAALAPEADPVWLGGGQGQRFSLWRLDFSDRPSRWRIEDDQASRSGWLFEASEPVQARYRHSRHLVIARDDLELETFMARPLEGREPAATVMLVHGGPWARDRDLYRDDLELLTAQGFNVLRVNYRGSRGKDHGLFLAGVREWGEGMREDLEDALSAMIAQGLVDPGRVCIMGHSYGGFAALNAVMRAEHPFRCAVAFAPVTDVPEQIRQFRSRRHERAFQEWQTMVGVPAELGASQLISPMQRLEQLQVPVLIAHGTADRRVSLSQSLQLVQSLERLNKSVQWLKLEQADHQLNDPSNRLHYYSQAITFLRSHLLHPSGDSPMAETDDRLPARNSTP